MASEQIINTDTQPLRPMVEKLESLENHPIQEDLDALLKLYDEPQNWNKLNLLKTLLYSDPSELEAFLQTRKDHTKAEMTTRHFNMSQGEVPNRRLIALPDMQTDAAFSWSGFCLHKTLSDPPKVAPSRDTPLPPLGARLAESLNRQTFVRQLNERKDISVAKVLDEGCAAKGEEIGADREMVGDGRDVVRDDDRMEEEQDIREDFGGPGCGPGKREIEVRELVENRWVWSAELGSTNDHLAFDNRGSLFFLKQAEDPKLLKLRLVRAKDKFGLVNLENSVHVVRRPNSSVNHEYCIFFLDRSSRLCYIRLVEPKTENDLKSVTVEETVLLESEFSCMVPSTVETQLICTSYDGEVTIVDLQPFLQDASDPDKQKNSVVKHKKLVGLQNYKVSAVACDMNLIAVVGVSVGHDNSWVVLLANMDLEPLGAPVKFDSDERRIPIAAFLTLQSSTLKRALIIMDPNLDLTAICMNSGKFDPENCSKLPRISISEFIEQTQLKKKALIPPTRRMFPESADYFIPERHRNQVYLA